MPKRRPVRDLAARDLASPGKLLRSFDLAGGFSAKGLAQASQILDGMVRDRDGTTFLSFPADIVATGTRGVLAELIRRRFVDVVITTCGTLDHDLARAWRPYYEGDWLLDDRALARRHVYRLGNVVIPQDNYGGILERKMRPILEKLWREGHRKVSTRELVWAIGESLGSRRGAGSICRAAYEAKVPVYVPGPTDGSVGSQLWMFWQDHRELAFDLFRDEQELSDLVFEAKRSHALILGGGISKHHVIWWNQFRGGLDSAVYITTAAEWDGSLSGARLREAVSWGKVKPNARQVTVEGDVTVLLPLLVGGLLESRPPVRTRG
ncbi:MAG: deoxyhypusine synthase [Euryarchaeota archaeon]|nr:deoxyhypusine synthase [Euryarchaeota archaeon]MDE1837476.1 deoxyhypusine synthase [Euryarchaeota archaeon]MDE1881780.1 deoxyhypusine synthase [Euryarchaeota archaeon]MDE2045558.1 deoxyhypusine synthase [Thermoplasmata archaeon]